MTTRTPTNEPAETLAELMEQLGNVPLSRVRLRPPPGTATEEDLLASGKKLVELVDCVLVEKAVGAKESLLAAVIARLLGNHVDEHDLGAVFGADGLFRLMPGLVRLPDVAFVPWENIPGEEVTDQPIAPDVPDLAVEVVSRSNTRAEINRKLRDYFLGGARLVWVIQPKTQTAQIYTSLEDVRRVGKTGSLDASPVIPGFTLSLPELFARNRRRKRSG
jgi:Uma2 family endonuclease